MQKSHFQEKSENTSKSYSKNGELVKKEILGVGITDASKEKVLEFIVDSIKKKAKPYYVVTPNPEILVLSTKNPDFKKILNYAKLASNDGIGTLLAGYFLGQQLHGRVTGVDLVKNLCEKVNDWPITVGFLGGGPGVAELTAECLKREFTNLKVSFAQAELSDEKKMPRTDILFIAFGVPKQEIWMAQHVGKVPVTVMVGVGGSFDYISGKVKRAPKLVRAFGLEWLFRLVLQPWRFRRQLALIEFIWLVLKEKFKK